MKLRHLYEQSGNNKFDKFINNDLKRLNKIYSDKGFEMRIVGGAVRDILSDKKPKDYDLATDATPEQSKKLLDVNNIKMIDVGGKRFGTIIAHMKSGDYEITTLRIDKDQDGRKTNVEYVKNWELDAERRDLTFNAMSLDFQGNLYDYFGGEKDLHAGTSRFVGNAEKRIQEDYLRILRYFRFQGKMKKPIFEPETMEIIKNNAKGIPENVTGERIWMEMKQILGGDHLTQIIRKMEETNVLENIYVTSINYNELVRVSKITNDFKLTLAAMLKSPSDLTALKNKWKLSNEEYYPIDFIMKYRDTHVNPEYLYFLSKIPTEYITLLLQYKDETLPNWDKLKSKEFPINGRDLNMKPGPAVGDKLAYLKKKWVDSNYSLNKEQLLDLATKY